MNDKRQVRVVASNGIGLAGILTIIFVVAKLWDRIDWSWIWVFSPLWLPTAVVLAILAAVATVLGVVWSVSTVTGSVSRMRRRKRRKNETR
jgi:hypothetical protein